MSCNVVLTEEETLCLHQYFERVDETEDLSFLYPAEYLAFQRIAGQVCKASSAMLKSNYDTLIEVARQSIAGGLRGEWTAVRSVARSENRLTQPASPHYASMKRRPAGISGDGLPVPSVEPRIEAMLRECIEAFETGALERANALLAVDARAISPFQGFEMARNFLTRVVASNGGARLTFHDVRANVEGRPQALGYFLYDGWRPDADRVPGEEADVFNFVLNLDSNASRIQSMIVL